MFSHNTTNLHISKWLKGQSVVKINRRAYTLAHFPENRSTHVLERSTPLERQTTSTALLCVVLLRPKEYHHTSLALLIDVSISCERLVRVSCARIGEFIFPLLLRFGDLPARALLRERRRESRVTAVLCFLYNVVHCASVCRALFHGRKRNTREEQQLPGRKHSHSHSSFPLPSSSIIRNTAITVSSQRAASACSER